MYDEILLPTDGSGGMKRVTEHALGLAELCGATIHALYVVDETAYETVPEDARHQVRDTLQEDGKSATKSIASRAEVRGIESKEEVRWGDPAVAIIAYAVRNDIDLIVMGTRGKTGFERYLLGSVAEKVLRVSPVPVVTVHLSDPEELVAEIEELLERNYE
ncbi:universal stress protein [Haladaptatus sp. DJG-WS-42]|uniref:universal stress protein n=1 Tax=Haladaptatus sp. DJG-WS-42 TaxID=3120516 RepID=UPI0030D44BAC